MKSKELKEAIRNLVAVVREEVHAHEVGWKDKQLRECADTLRKVYKLLTGEDSHWEDVAFVDELGASVLRAARAQAIRTEPPTVRLPVAYVRTMHRKDVPVGGRFYLAGVKDAMAQISTGKMGEQGNPESQRYGSYFKDDKSWGHVWMMGTDEVIMLGYNP